MLESFIPFLIILAIAITLIKAIRLIRPNFMRVKINALGVNIESEMGSGTQDEKPKS